MLCVVDYQLFCNGVLLFLVVFIILSLLPMPRCAVICRVS